MEELGDRWIEGVGGVLGLDGGGCEAYGCTLSACHSWVCRAVLLLF